MTKTYWAVLGIAGAVIAAVSFYALTIKNTEQEVAVLKADMSAKASSHNLQFSLADAPLPDCESWCSESSGDWRCFPTGNIDDDKDEELMSLIKALTAPEPVTLSQVNLLKMFGLTNLNLEGVRNATEINGGELTNTGQASKLVTKAHNTLVNVDVPEKINYSYAHKGDGFFLREKSSGTSFVLSLDDETLNHWYGGRIRAISAAPHKTIFYAKNGCVAYETGAGINSMHLANSYVRTTSKRIAAEVRADASRARVLSVFKSYLNVAGSNDLCTIGSVHHNNSCMDCSATPSSPISCKKPGTTLQECQTAEHGCRPPFAPCN